MNKFKLSKSIYALLTAGVMLFSSCGINNKMNESNINNIMGSDVSFDDVLESVSDDSMIDEELNLLDYKNNIEMYKTRKKDNHVKEAGKELAYLGEKMLKIEISKMFNIKLNDIKKFDIYSVEKEYDDVYVKVETKDFKKEILLKDEARDIGLAIVSAEQNQIYNIEFVDKMYKALGRFLLTTGEYNKNDEAISFNYDDEKIEKFKKYIKR